MAAVGATRADWPEDEVWVALESVDEPGDLGTIIRTCDAAGATGLILLDALLDPYDASATRASMGALFAQRFVRASVLDLAYWKRRQGLRFVGISRDAATAYRSVRYSGTTVLCMGDQYRDQQVGVTLYDMLVHLPLARDGASLGLAAEIGILLYEVVRQQQNEGMPNSLAPVLASARQ